MLRGSSSGSASETGAGTGNSGGNSGNSNQKPLPWRNRRNDRTGRGKHDFPVQNPTPPAEIERTGGFHAEKSHATGHHAAMGQARESIGKGIQGLVSVAFAGEDGLFFNAWVKVRPNDCQPRSATCEGETCHSLGLGASRLTGPAYPKVWR